MRFEHEGMSLWYGTSDAPAPNESVAPGTEVIITVGVEPADASNKIEVPYRVNGGPAQTAPTRWLRSSLSGEAQYFEARLGPFRDGDTVEYTSICKCAGRQVPQAEEGSKCASSFRVTEDAIVGMASREALPPGTASGTRGSGDASAKTALISPLAVPMGTGREMEDRRSALINPRVSERTVADLNPTPVGSKPSSENPKLLKQYVITGTIIAPEGVERIGINVQAFNRDLPSLERRTGSAPQMLGKAVTNAEGRFQITYILEPFLTGEGTLPYSRVREKNANISFRVFDRVERELNINRVQAGVREYLSDKIIFNGSASLDVSVFVDAPRESDASEYEQLIALIAPVVEDLPLTKLSDEDAVFLINEFGLEQQPEVQQRIEWVRRCALLAQETNLPVESFYGWGRKDVPAELAKLATVSLKNLPSVIKELTGLRDEKLRDALLAAIKQNIIPVSSGARVDEIVRQLKRRDQVLHEVIAQLLDEETKAVLAGYTVTTFDQDSGEENRGLDITNNKGQFSFSFYAPRNLPQDAPARRFAFKIQPPEGDRISEVEVVDINPNQSEADIIKVSIKLPKPLVPTLEALRHGGQIDIPNKLLVHLKDQKVHTFADIRRRGGLGQLSDVSAIESALKVDWSHWLTCDRVSSNVRANTQLIDRGFDRVSTIANSNRSIFMETARSLLGDCEAAKLHTAAKVQTKFLNNLAFDTMTAQANGFPETAEQKLLADVHPKTCSCKDCESAVSPLAYLADLILYTTQHVTNDSQLINIDFLVQTFYQQLRDLSSSCEASERQVRQVPNLYRSAAQLPDK